MNEWTAEKYARWDRFDEHLTWLEEQVRLLGYGMTDNNYLLITTTGSTEVSPAMYEQTLESIINAQEGI